MLRHRRRYNDWISCASDNRNTTFRLFCFPYAGGGASIYHAWSKNFPDNDIEICPVQFPGREERLNITCLTQLSEIIEQLVVHLQSLLDKPFAFFGHSMGAIVAFELAKQIQTRSPLIHFFASACPAPQLPYLKTPIHKLPDSDFITALQERYQNIPPAVLREKEMIALMLPIIRADLCLFETYDYFPGQTLTCPITAFGGLHDNTTSQNQLNGWREQTTNTFFQHMLDGDHFFLKSAQKQLVQFISQALKQ